MLAMVVMIAGKPLLASDWQWLRGYAAGTGTTNDSLPAEPKLLWELALGGRDLTVRRSSRSSTIYLGDVDGHVVPLI